MVSIREMVKALEGGDETPAAQKVFRIKLKSANVSEIAYVIESLYHDYLGTGSRSSSVGGFQGFSFPGGGVAFTGLGGRGIGPAAAAPTPTATSGPTRSRSAWTNGPTRCSS